jgi:predicted transposase YdaD
MAKPADLSAKSLINLAPENWAKWVTEFSDISVSDVFSSEFQWISRQGDVLIRAFSPRYGEFLIANEVQLRYNKYVPRRVRCYTGLAEEKYKLPVYPVLINILPSKDNPAEIIPTTYDSTFAGLRAIQDYRVINLWEVDMNIAFTQDLISLIPFVPILKGGDDEGAIRQALNIIRQDGDLAQLETVLDFFANFVLKSNVVAEIMRWDMAVLRESPWYQEIYSDGKIEGKIEAIEKILAFKFDAPGLELMPQISLISDENQLNLVLRRIALTSSLAEVHQFIQELRGRSLNS